MAGVRKGRERGFWSREKREGRARREGGKLPRARSRGQIPFIFPFERLPSRLAATLGIRFSKVSLL